MCTRWQIGDQVCALLPGGGYAEYVVTHEAHALPIPTGMSLREAACLPETCFTVWSNVVMRGGLRAGERFLVHGGTIGHRHDGDPDRRGAGRAGVRDGGVGREMRRSAAAWGPRGRSTTASEDFVAEMQAEGGANLILDMVGGPYIAAQYQGSGR